MAVVVPAAGGAVAIGALLGAGLTALACFLVLYGLLKGYEYTLGALLTSLASKTRGIRWIGGRIADALEGIDNFILDQIGKGILASEKAAAKFFHGIAWIWEASIDATVELAKSTADAIEGLVEGVIPNTVTVRTREVVKTVSKETAWVRARMRAEERQRATGIDRLGRDLAAEKLARERGIDALDAKVAARLDGIQDRVAGELARTRDWVSGRIQGLDARVGTVTGLVAAGGVAAIALRTLDRSFPWWKCSNVRGFNRMLCRSPRGSIEDLLGLSLLAVGSLSIVDFARELQNGVGFASDAVHEWIVED